MRDNLHGNTPLHWALLAKNLHAVAQLVTKFNADVDAVNLQGKVIHPKYSKHLKKGGHRSRLGRQKMGCFLAN